MKGKLLIAFVVVSGLAITSVDAQTIQQKSKTQQAKIHQGVKDGSLTKKETYRLEKEQQHIRHEKVQAKRNDGCVSHKEKKHIRHDQRKADRHIHHAKHNPQKRY